MRVLNKTAACLAVAALLAVETSGVAQSNEAFRADPISTAQLVIQTFFPHLNERRLQMLLFWNDPFDSHWTTARFVRRFAVNVVENSDDFLRGREIETADRISLSAYCVFDDSGEIDTLAIHGSVVQESKNRELREEVDHHREWTDDQVIAALKRHGAAVGQDQEQRLQGSLSTNESMSLIFGGLVRVSTIAFESRVAADSPVDRSALVQWRAVVDVNRSGRPDVRYVLYFEPIGGALTQIVRAR
jgi:hypothetical protein